MDIGSIIQENNPLNKFAQGFQIGAMMRQQQAMNADREAKAEEIRKQAERAGMLQTSLGEISAMQDPYERVQGLNNLMVKFPEMADKLKSQASFYSDEVKANATNQLLPALNALNIGQKDIAIDRLTQARDAFKNSGNNRGAQSLDMYIQDIKTATDTAPLVQTGYLTLASILGPDKLMETLSKSQDYAKTQAVMPSEISKEQSSATVKAEEAKRAPMETAIKQEELNRAPIETQIKATQAKFEETKQAQDLEKRGWDIAKLKNDIDISKQNAKIAMMNASLSKEANMLKRKELGVKLQEAIDKRDESLRQKSADIENARASMDNMLNTAQKIISTPIDIVESATGPLSTRLPTLKQSTADFEALIDNLGSQAFLAQIPNIKGMGALSNAEGEKLQQALQNFSLKQSPQQLIGNIKEAQRLILKGRKNLADKYGVPDTAPDIQGQSAISKGSEIQKIPAGVIIKRIK